MTLFCHIETFSVPLNRQKNRRIRETDRLPDSAADDYDLSRGVMDS